MEEDLEKLNCPFTWNLEKFAHSKDNLTSSHFESRAALFDKCDEEQGDVLLLNLMYKTTKAYECTELNRFEDAMTLIALAEKNVATLKKTRCYGFSISAVDHVVKATKCFILKSMDRSDDIPNILSKIKFYQSALVRGTFYGCESAALYFYHHAAMKQAAKRSKSALILNPYYWLWQFLHSRSLQRIRKNHNLTCEPSFYEEKESIVSYRMDKNPYTCLNYADILRDIDKIDSAREIYSALLATKPSSCYVYLKLAIGFIHCKDSTNAEFCLNYIKKRMPKNDNYIYCLGLFNEKCVENYEESLNCYMMAGAMFNFRADISCIMLGYHISLDHNPMEHLNLMNERYQHFGGYRMQIIFMHMGAFYDISCCNAKNACKYYVQAIEIDPENNLLRNFFSQISENKFSIIDALRSYILPKLKKTINPENETSAIMKRAEKILKQWKNNDNKSFSEMIKIHNSEFRKQSKN